MPNFLVIGAQRAGTTWLWKNLSRHPDLFVAATKELEFFSFSDNLTEAGWAQYLENFAGKGHFAWRGECTPSYFITVNRRCPWHSYIRGFNGDIPKSVVDWLGADTRIILTLRQPVDRAVSAYFHHVQHGRIQPGTSIIEVGKVKALISAGFYARHLTAWRKYFSAERLCIVTTTQIKEQPVATLEKVRLFFDDSLAGFPAPTQSANRGVRKFRTAGTIGQLKRPLFGAKVGAEDLRQLVEIYREDLEQLQTITEPQLYDSLSSHSRL